MTAIRVVVVGWVVAYGVILATADELPPPLTALMQRIVPPLLVVAVVRLVRPGLGGDSVPGVDTPARLLDLAVATLPVKRWEWGQAMAAELAGIDGRSARWRFALSSIRGTLLLPPVIGWPALAGISGLAVASAAAAAVVEPRLRIFAVAFTGTVGAMMVLSVARSGRPRAALMPALSVGAAVMATVLFVRRESDAVLPGAAAIYLAVALAGCLMVGKASRGQLTAVVVFAAWFLLVFRLDVGDPPLPLLILLVALDLGLPIAVFFVPAFLAGRAGASIRSGLSAPLWIVAAAMPLTYALWLPIAVWRHGIDGRTLDGELVAPVGVNLVDAMIFCFGVFPLLGLTIGALGAVLGSRREPIRPST